MVAKRSKPVCLTSFFNDLPTIDYSAKQLGLRIHRVGKLPSAINCRFGSAYKDESIFVAYEARPIFGESLFFNGRFLWV